MGELADDREATRLESLPEDVKDLLRKAALEFRPETAALPKLSNRLV